MAEEKKVYKPADEGSYKVRLEKYEVKDTKAGTGKYLDLQFEIMESKEHDFGGKRIFQKYNIENPNPKAVEISMNILGHYLTAVGLSDEESKEVKSDVTKLDDTIGIPFIAEVKIKDEGPYGMKNHIAKYLAR